jgi:MFS family permease
MFRREHIGYALAVLMDMCLMATLFFAMTRRAADAGLDAARLGWLGAGFFLAYAIVAPMAGKLADRFGRRRFMVVGLVVSGALMWLCAFETRFAALLAIAGVIGAASALFWPSLMAWFTEGRRGVALVSVLGVYCICWNAGLAAGSVGSGALYEVSPRLSFYVFGSITLAAPLLLLLRTAPLSTLNSRLSTGVSRPTALHFMWAAWLANLASLLGLGAVVAMFPQLATHLDIRPALHGQMIAASRVAAMAAFVVMGWSHAWHHRTWPLLAGYLVSAAGAVAIAATSSVPWFFAGFIALGFINGATYLASIFYALEAFEGKAAGAGWTEMVLGAGSFIGPVAAGMVGGQWGLRAPYWFAGALFAVGLLAQIGLAWAGRGRYKQGAP